MNYYYLYCLVWLVCLLVSAYAYENTLPDKRTILPSIANLIMLIISLPVAYYIGTGRFTADVGYWIGSSLVLICIPWWSIAIQKDWSEYSFMPAAIIGTIGFVVYLIWLGIEISGGA